ncbi:MAG: TonB-dependent receptor [Gammaproteobacteria bacterium]|nr:MAG: TonB-dependent receptor [Gammaproteobacteria bacterium]
MTSMASSLRAEIAAILACTATAMAFAPAALAQQQDDEDEITVAVAADEEEPTVRVVDTITVTGSRIRRDEFTSTSPITVITSERTQLAGLLTTEDILQRSTIASGQQVNDSFSGFITDGGPGANNVSLRGLGAQRTLVLVNGKRWSPSGVQGFTNNVDLSAIPSSIVGRIEILKDGASSIYGADAVAGVVNVITRESFDGLQFNAQTQLTHDGGGERYVFDLAWGKVADRGSISFAAQYATQESLQAADRRWSRCPVLPRLTDQDGDGTIDNTDPFTGDPLCFGFIYGLGASALLGFVRYEPSLTDPTDTSNPFYDPMLGFLPLLGGLQPIPLFTRVPENGLFKPGSPPLQPFPPAFGGPEAPFALFDNQGPFYRDTRSPGIQNIQTPSNLISLTSFGSLDIDIGNSQSTVYYEAYFNSRSTQSTSGFAQFFPAVNAFTFDGANLHPFNPFSQLPAFCGGNPVCGLVQPVLPTYEIRDPTFAVDVDRYNVFAGIEGDLGGTSWFYDLFVGYGRSTGTYRAQQFLDDRVQAAVNGLVIDAETGEVVCAPTVRAQFPDCVPANLFTEDALLRGQLPDSVLSFIRKDTEGKTVYEGTTISGYLTGDLMNLPAGPVGVVLGGEFREEFINDVPDIEAQRNNFWGFSTAGITRGRDRVTEVFTEVEVPVLSGMRFAEELTLTGALRWTDYKSFGSDTTYKLGLAYAVTPEVLLRSTYGTSFRPPALYEQFLSDFTGFASNLSDPCINYGSISQPGDPLYDNCAADGLPPTFFNPSSILVNTAGAAGLEAETSEAVTVGIAYTPDWINVSFAVDYFDIKVKDTIASPSAAGFLAQCYTSLDRSSPFCERIGPRNAQNVVTFVDASYLNIGRQQSRGIDLNAVYQRELPAGRLFVDASATYLDRQNIEIFGTVTNLEGRWGYPRWSAQTQARYDWRDWRFAWSTSFIGKSKEGRQFDPGTENQNRQNRTPNYLTHTLSARYTAANWETIFTIRNVFDKAPPVLPTGTGAQGASRFLNTLPGVGYDLFGRSYVIQLSYKF